MVKMASGLVPKIRLVKCPKCRMLLQEHTDVPVYQCAACETILQAKNWKVDENDGSSSRETDPVQTSISQPMSEYNKGSSSLSHETLLLSSGDHSLDQENVKHQTESVDSISEQLVAVKASSGEQKNDNGGYESSLSSVGQSGVSNGAGSSPKLAENENNRFSPFRGAKAEMEANNENVALSAKGSKGDVANKRDSDSKPNAVKESSSLVTYNMKKPRIFSTVLSHDKHYGTRYGKWDRSQMGFYARGPSFSGRHEIGSSSDQTYDEFYSRFRSREMPEHGRRIPYDLSWKEKHTSAYHNHKVPSQIYQNIDYGRCTGELERIGRGSGKGRKSKFSQIPLSQEMMNGRYQMGPSCLCSGQYPPHIPRQFYPSFDHRNSYSSYPASPRRLSGSKYYPRWSHQVASGVEDRRHGGYEAKKYRREGCHVSKRHIRPTAGAAPFVICYGCSATIQLPLDFLIFKKKHHLLKCGACLNVLRFSLQNRSRTGPAVLDPRPSQDTKTNGNENAASCSDDHAEDNNASESGSRSSKVSKPGKTATSENVQLLQTRCSPLHLLMGYSSVSQVFKASGRPPSLTYQENKYKIVG